MDTPLKLIRQFHNIKQGQLASAIGISNSYLSEIESGKKEVTMDLLKKVCWLFQYANVFANALFGKAWRQLNFAEKFRVNFTAKIKQIMEWVVAKDDHFGAKKVWYNPGPLYKLQSKKKLVELLNLTSVAALNSLTRLEIPYRKFGIPVKNKSKTRLVQMSNELYPVHARIFKLLKRIELPDYLHWYSRSVIHYEC